ncbi:MAG: hypothetical protein LJE65_15025 [Desulfobacteraceae bacterium]|nr:hypothetical protein [Desulfobacteraceae bacterium]
MIRLHHHHSLLRMVLAAGLLFVAVDCGSSGSDSQSGSSGPVFTECPAYRPPPPVACTLQYDPVCGRLSDGSTRTYDNDCNACADPEVQGYWKGSCPQQ